MKKIKFLLLSLFLFSIIAVIALKIIRHPSYSIQTSGKLYIVNKLSSSITVFDLYQGKELAEFPIEIEPHEATTLAGQNRVVVTNYGATNVVGKSITVINSKTNKVEKTIDLQKSLRPHGIIAFPNSNKVGVVTDSGNELLIVDVEKGTIEEKIPTQQHVSHLLVLHPQKPLAYVTNINSNSLSVIDLELNQVIKNIPCGLGTEGIDITPDGSEIWVTNTKDNTINIISTSTNKITDTLTTGNQSLRLKFSVDGKLCLVTNAKDGTISVYYQKSKKQIKIISIQGKTKVIERILYHTPRPVGVLMHPNGLYAFVTNSNANTVEVIDMKTLTIVSTIGTGKIPDGMALVESNFSEN